MKLSDGEKLTVFDSIRPSLGMKELSAAQIAQILKARTHPSHST